MRVKSPTAAIPLTRTHFNLSLRAQRGNLAPSPLMGEGWGEGENPIRILSIHANYSA